MPTLSTSPPPPPKHIHVYVGPSGSGKSTAAASFLHQHFEDKDVTYANDSALSSLWQHYHHEDVIYIENMNSCIYNNPHLTPTTVLDWLTQFNNKTITTTEQIIRASYIIIFSYTDPVGWWQHMAVNDDTVKAIVAQCDVHTFTHKYV